MPGSGAIENTPRMLLPAPCPGPSISLEKLTEVAHMSKSSLTRCFQRALGVSPIEYLIRLRVRKAADLLRSSDTRIIGVAFSVGFTDGNYFARQFRALVGCSPREFVKLRTHGY